MNKDKVERSDKIPSGCPSPARLEKTDSSSSRQSGSPLHWDFESWNHTGRIRPSSWDDSDDDLSPKPEMSGSKASRIYSSESNEFRNSISAEINELKRQFFKSLEKENDSLRLENLKEKLEMKFKCDRRQSPARVRRRSRSSSSSSPLPESQNSPETKEKGIGPDLEFDDSDSVSPGTSGLDSSYYLNNFFSELRSKRISMLDSVPMMDKAGRDDVLICDSMKLEMLNELNAPDLNDDSGYFCKTSRKLSQILEVEENRKDLEKSSEDSMEKPELFTRDFRKPELNDSSSPPLQTSGSKRSETVVQSGGDGKQRKREGYKSLSFEEFGSFQKVGKPSRGSLSERSAQVFEPKIDDDFIHLCAKTGKTQLGSPKLIEGQDAEKSFQFLCFAGAPGGNQNLWAEPTPRKEGTEKDSDACGYLNLTVMPGSPTSRKSTNRSEQSHTSRTKSERSRKSSKPQSPRYMLSLGGDSARSLRVDDVNTSHSQSKSEKSKSVSQSKRSSSEDCSARNSNKSSFRSEDTFQSKTDKILHMTLESPSLESLKSSRSLSEHRTARNNLRSKPSTQRSQIGNGNSKDANVEHAPVKQNLAFENCRNSPVGSGRSMEKANSTSCRSESSKNTPKSPRTLEDGFNNCASDQRTPRSHKIPELGLPLEILGMSESRNASCRSPKVPELDDSMKDTDRPSDRNFGSRSRSGRFRKSTPRTRSATPKTSGSNSIRSKDSLENHEEEPRIFFSEEFESVYDALSNHSPVSAATRKSSCRETNMPSQQLSCRSENSALRKTFTPKLDNPLEERLFGSRKTQMRSIDSWDKTSAGSPGNVSPIKSEQTKSRPTSWTSGESKFTDVPPDVEKLDINVRSGRTTNRSSISEEYEEKEEHRLGSSPASRSEVESDRQSNKRLSVINEVTFEDLDNGTTHIENEEKDFWKKSRPPSRRSSKRGSPKSVTIASGESFKGKPRGESAPRKHPSDRGMWTELIQTFEGSQNSSLLSEKNFPGFLSQKEEISVKLSVHPSERETSEQLYDDNDIVVVSLEDSFELSRKAGTPKSEKKQILERTSNQQREEDFSFNLVHKDSLTEKMEAEEERPFPSPQNLYYVDVDKGGPFGIGEFGDMTWWSDGKSDLQDLGKPKDHGDGVHSFKSSEVLILKPEKREKEIKNQRQLWTELKEDFRNSQLFSNDRFPGVESNFDYARFIPVGLKASKSDNCINRKLKERSECQSSVTCEFLGENNKRENMREGNMNPTSRNLTDHLGSGSVDSTKEGSEMAEFDCERTPRLSRSMSDLVTQLPLERYKNKDLSESHDSSRAQLFEKLDSGNEMKEPVNMDTFLPRKKEETVVKSNNWLHLKTPDRKKSDKRDKKAKSNMKKGARLSREPYVGYLISRKSQQSTAGLKLRNSNCFQNFYKRYLLNRFRRKVRLDQLLILSQKLSDNLIPNVSFCDGKNGCGGNNEVEDDCTFLFTSESVGEGHPDKMCDQISDAILDAHLQQDPDAKVACETVTKSSMILVSGEITSKAVVDYHKVVRETIRHIGYDDSSKGFDYSNCSVMLMIDEQSSNIAAGVHLNKTDEEIGAGDQGLMFGYATDETDECMPLTIVLAHRLNQKIAELRRNEEFWWARPDSKAQVTCEYKLDGGACIPRRVHTVVVSLQHSEKISLKDLRSQILLRVIKNVIPEKYIDSRTIFHINPCGVFLIGGPKGDAGLTGRKTIVDTYGGWGAHGGGSFSGKDFTKVDRSAAYACRWVAKSLVKAGLCRRCLIQVSYAIGIAEPLSISLFDYGTSKLSRNKLMEIVNKNFDLRPGKIAINLNLKTPIYQKTSIYGHFGRCCFPWEQPKALTQ